MSVLNLFKDLLKDWESKLIGALNIIFLVFIFPLHWLTTIPFIILSAIAFYIIFSKASIRLKKRFKHRIVALIIILSVASWALVGPFFIYQRPTYIFFQEDIFAPWEAKSIALFDGHPEKGTLLILSDPVRRYLFKFARSIDPMYIRELVLEHIDSESFVIMPLVTKFEHNKPGIVLSQKLREIHVPSTVLPIQYDMGNENSSPISRATGNVGLRVSLGDLMSFYYVSSPERPPWEGVPISNTRLEPDLRYAALLDHSLFLMSIDPTSAFMVLDEATKYATNYMEQARTFTLLGIMAEDLLTGNLGQLQSLLFYHKAFERIQHTNLNNRPIFKRTPAENWVYRYLLETYMLYGPLFNDRVALLRPMEMQLSESLSSGTTEVEKVEEFLKKYATLYHSATNVDSQEFIHKAFELIKAETLLDNKDDHFFVHEEKSIDNLSPDKLKSTVNALTGQESARLFCDMATSSLVSEFVTKMAYLPKPSEGAKWIANNDLETKIDVVRIAAKKNSSFWESFYLNQLDLLYRSDKLLRSFFELASRPNATETDAFKFALNALQDTDLYRYNLPLTKQFVKITHLTNPDIKEKEILNLLNSPSPDADWWTIEYLEWFFFQVGKAGAQKEALESGKKSLQEMLQIESIVSDHRGKGSPFIPGIVFLTLASESKESTLHENLKIELEK